MTSHLPDPVRKLAHSLVELPGIGPRQATRLAIFLAGRDGGLRETLTEQLAALHGVKLCERCFFLHQNDGSLCNICKDPSRDQSAIMIVEKETDLLSLENTKKFKGRYLIIGPIPKIGVLEDWQKKRLATFKEFIKKELGSAKEVILGFNLTSVGDFNASLITKELAGLAKKLTRLGRGLPTGGEIEFADDETLGSAFDGRS